MQRRTARSGASASSKRSDDDESHGGADAVDAGVWWIIATIVIVLLLVATLAVSSVALSHVTHFSRNEVSFNAFALAVGVARGQRFNFTVALEPGQACSISAHELPDATLPRRVDERAGEHKRSVNSRPSCLLCPCFPPDLVWRVDPNGDHSDVDRLCPAHC